jgi:hypothetical protein
MSIQIIKKLTLWEMRDVAYQQLRSARHFIHSFGKFASGAK